MTKTFSKDPKTYPELLQKLESDGLKITDQTAALRHLKQISYYRLKGYGLAFRQYDETGKRLSTYQPNVELVTLIHMSMIDAELRSLILAAIDRIEVEVRNVINHELSIKYNSSHWFLDENLFQSSDQFKHQDFLGKIKQFTAKKADAGSEKEKLRETFIHHYYQAYDTPEYPPCWMIAEVLPLGSWSKLYEHLVQSKDRKQVSKQFDLSPELLESWLHALTYLRNVCAHQGRLFNRTFAFPPKQGKKAPLKTQHQLYNYICILFLFLKEFNHEYDWLERIEAVLKKCPNELLKFYGFDENWLEKDEDYWMN
ncbi:MULTISPECIES: Abi family protein [Acinetobacter]|uniref:Abi family protein n=1 Tax=Acinetobacter TaxID=469 RepID=UPI00044A77F6|nr:MULTISPECIES: Abi family protein [Acinetobacter]KCY50712.1 abi-like family protein [Acinetobacter baumannii 1571545]EXB17152.1 abi-like family protein [Acinetobacter baumannii 1429530]MCK0878008.1 Abi family protein [Acinetobacter pittii]MDC4142969.1 Abi family protein [Acinetobacter nosocomialis]MDC4491280.1 Abi family protein [Acinetobacter baumannii]